MPVLMLDAFPATQDTPIAFVWALNLGIAFWNARGCGLAWIEAKAAGGRVRFMAWMGAVMAACGFTWCYLIPAALVANRLHYIGDHQATLAIEAGYCLMIPAILLAGYAIMLGSWANAFRSGRLGDYGVAVYNTAANLRDTYDLWTSFWSVYGDVLGAIAGGKTSSRKLKDLGVIIMLSLVIIALSLGIFTTAAILRRYAGSREMAGPYQDEGSAYADW